MLFPSIEDFETQLRNDGYLVIKFFLHISEQTPTRAFGGFV